MHDALPILPGLVRLVEDRDERVDDRGDDGVDDRGERAADDDGHGQVDHVSAEDELLEPFDHCCSLVGGGQDPDDDAAAGLLELDEEEEDDDSLDDVPPEPLPEAAASELDRQSVVSGKRVSVRVDPVGRGYIKKKKRQI